MIQGAIRGDHCTWLDSSSCSRKLPAVWKNFFGMIGARSRTFSSANSSPVGPGGASRSKYSRIVGTSSRAILSPRSSPTLPSSKVTRRAISVAADLHCRARIDLGRPYEPRDLEVLAQLRFGQPRRRPVVERRDPVAREHARIGEPADDIGFGRGAEDLRVRLPNGGDDGGRLLDLA